MDEYRHHVSGFFSNHDEAKIAFSSLIGTVAGATKNPVKTTGTGDKNKEGWLSELVRDAIASGQIVLVGDTRTDQETSIARAVIQAAVGDYKETSTV